QREVRVMVRLLGGGTDAVDELETGREVAGGEADGEGLTVLAPAGGDGVDDLGGGEGLLRISHAPIVPLSGPCGQGAGRAVGPRGRRSHSPAGASATLGAWTICAWHRAPAHPLACGCTRPSGTHSPPTRAAPVASASAPRIHGSSSAWTWPPSRHSTRSSAGACSPSCPGSSPAPSSPSPPPSSAPRGRTGARRVSGSPPCCAEPSRRRWSDARPAPPGRRSDGGWRPSGGGRR